MRHFFLYIIKKEFAEHYYQREAKIFQLFQEYQWTSRQHPSFKQLEKQVHYVTKKIPFHYVDMFLESYLSHRSDYQHVTPIHTIQLKNHRGSASVILKERLIELVSTGNIDAEIIFFEALRKINSHFFAMDFANERFGWLHPIKDRNFVKNSGK